ncbi:MAG: LytTR family DNA-binding domain-containing protein [Candidatus Kapaibacterium sp.]|nr:LytTR family DNA-binding domain-containing protein [Bacteroidota bacterium]
MKVLIIDNEEPLRTALKTLLQNYCPDVDSIAEASGVEAGILALRKQKYDIVFLDVEMDDGTGFDLLRKVDTSMFQLVFITAHQHYAIDAFKFSATDFLLKPVQEDELQRSVERAQANIEKHNKLEQVAVLLEGLEPRAYQEKRIVLRDQDAIHFIRVPDISVLEAHKGYTKFILVGGKSVFVSKTLKEFDDMLTPYGFIRVHHSYMVNSRRIVRFDRDEGGSVITEENIVIPVSQRKRDSILKILSE